MRQARATFLQVARCCRFRDVDTGGIRRLLAVGAVVLLFVGADEQPATPAAVIHFWVAPPPHRRRDTREGSRIGRVEHDQVASS